MILQSKEHEGLLFEITGTKLFLFIHS